MLDEVQERMISSSLGVNSCAAACSGRRHPPSPSGAEAGERQPLGPASHSARSAVSPQIAATPSIT